MRSHRMRGLAGNAGIPQDYIALWDMAGNALDATGNYDMTLFGGAVQNADHVAFDGTDDYGQCPRLAFSTGWTLAFRARADALTVHNEWIVNSRTSTSGAGNEWQMLFLSTGVLTCRVWNTSDTPFNVSTSSSVGGSFSTFAVRLSASSLELHDTDGLVDSVTFSGTPQSGATATHFARRGWDGDGTEDHGDISLSRTVAYDRALSDAELSRTLAFIRDGA